MKKIFILGLSALILAGCGLSEEEKTKQWLLENINANHLEAYLHNNGFENLKVYDAVYKGDSVSVITNDFFIIEQLLQQGKFTGADDAYNQLNTVFSEANSSPEMILYDDTCKTFISIITEHSKIEFVYFLVYTKKSEENGLTFLSFPFVDDYTSNNMYYDEKAVEVINSFTNKINDGDISKGDTLISNKPEPEFYGDGISAELIPSLTMNPNKSTTKKETRKGQDKSTGEYYTADVEVTYSGKKKSWSKIRDYFLDTNSNIYVTEDVDYISNYDFMDRFPNLTNNIIRIRLRKFDIEGVLEWTFCGLPCSTDSIFSDYDDLSILSVKLIKDTLNVVVYEGNHSFSFNNYNGLKEFEVDKHVIKINPDNGNLYSFQPMNNNMYSDYEAIKGSENTEKLYVFESENILKEPYHLFIIGKQGTSNFYKPFDYVDCDCVID